MTDDQLEQLLRASRPVGPPAELRARIVTTVRGTPRAWPWVAAAAALLALTISFQLSATRELSVIRGVVPLEEQTRDADDPGSFLELDAEAVQALKLRRQLERRLAGAQEQPLSR